MVDKIAGIDTSFKAHITKRSNHKPKFGIIMEYDALPDIGHACGHSASGSIDLPNTKEKVEEAIGSSDIENVSYVCPAFHPMMAISDHYFPLHTKKVTDIMKSDSINEVIS